MKDRKNGDWRDTEPHCVTQGLSSLGGYISIHTAAVIRLFNLFPSDHITSWLFETPLSRPVCCEWGISWTQFCSVQMRFSPTLFSDTYRKIKKIIPNTSRYPRRQCTTVGLTYTVVSKIAPVDLLLKPNQHACSLYLQPEQGFYCVLYSFIYFRLSFYMHYAG